jgi:hypothetical protein
LEFIYKAGNPSGQLWRLLCQSVVFISYKNNIACVEAQILQYKTKIIRMKKNTIIKRQSRISFCKAVIHFLVYNQLPESMKNIL